MLGERTWPTANNDTPNMPHAPAWTDGTPTSVDTNRTDAAGKNPYLLTFMWPPVPNGSVTPSVAPTVLASSHPGVVIVYYFDGHGDKVRDDTLVNQDSNGNSMPGCLVPPQ
jgi:hypothetical protein